MTAQNNPTDDDTQKLNNNSATQKLQQSIDLLQKQKSEEEKKDIQVLEAKKQAQIKANSQVVSNPFTSNYPPLRSDFNQSFTQAPKTADENQKQQVVQTIDKERKEQLFSSNSSEQAPFQEIQSEIEKVPELEKWIKPIPDAKTITLPEPVTDEFGEILIQATQIPRPNITLPLTEEEMQQGKKHPIVDAFLWLSEWCKRNLLLAPKRIFLKKTE